MPKKAVQKTAGVKIRLVKSLIGSKKDQIATAEALGLRKVGSETVQPDNAQTQGKIKKISHLVEVSEA
jgi:large subunit ribosomal protein L30